MKSNISSLINKLSEEYIILRDEHQHRKTSAREWEIKGEINTIGYEADLDRLDEIVEITDKIKTEYLQSFIITNNAKEFEESGIELNKYFFKESPLGVVVAINKPISYHPLLDNLGNEIKVGDLLANKIAGILTNNGGLEHLSESEEFSEIRIYSGIPIKIN